MCISDFYLCANVTKYTDTKMSLFSYFLHTCEQLERKFLLWFWRKGEWGQLGREASWATPCIAKSDFPAACLVPSSEYKLHYLLTIFGKKLFQLNINYIIYFFKDTKKNMDKIFFLCRSSFENIFDVHFMVIIYQCFKI